MEHHASLAPRAFPKPGVPVFEPDDLRLVLVARRAETANVTTYFFEAIRQDGQTFRHHPGQSLSLTLPSGSNLFQRSFTIASGGMGGNCIELTIKTGAQAQATLWMHRYLHIGDTLAARGPFGRFSLVHAPKAPLLLVGAGSGMTPIMSMLRWLRVRADTLDTTLVQLARSCADELFGDEIGAMADAMPNLSVHLCLSRPDKTWTGLSGRITRPMLRGIVPDMARRVAFCCGPEPVMKATRAIYLAEGGVENAFVTETFGGAEHDAASRRRQVAMHPAVRPVETLSRMNLSVPTPIDKGAWCPAPRMHERAKPASAPGPSSEDLMIGFRDKNFPAKPGQSVVAAAAASGLRIPTGCGQGSCGTCRVRLMSGQVDMHDQGGISRRDKAVGYILACCSYPLSDLELGNDLAGSNQAGVVSPPSASSK
ncbi:flavin reductase family protein [Mesorhizobium silamurunense]|uniref:flavin reductase family protein n=1 Tax=Mesorhizobium silamurunense TaxID=499528 RepID=UPI001782D807|nr:iron-sulfur cluster-binding domain-containing protein [Mesorhizobium silamurunense]